MLRDILAGVAGIAVAVAIVMLAEELNHVVYPPPPGLDLNDPESMRAAVAQLPFAALLMLMGGWVLATFVGAVLADRIGTAKAWIYPTIVGLVMFAGTAANLILIPHPLWFSILALLAILLSAWLAWKVTSQS
jgi:hypothetical protein